MSMRTELLLALLGGILSAAALALAWHSHRRFSAVLKGSTTDNLEQILRGYVKQVELVDRKATDLAEKYEQLAKSTALASQKISIVRFNPFGDTGGDQSFTLAVLDAHNSGYVITSIHGREGTRVYVKPIDSGKSKYTLSDEEKQALSQAAKRVIKE